MSGKDLDQPFKAIISQTEFAQEIERFYVDMSAPMPIWVGNRLDLIKAD